VGAYATRLVVFQRYDPLTRPTVSIGLFLGAVMIVGAWLGRRLLDRLSEEGFVRVIEGAPGELRGPLPPLPGSLAGDVARHPPLTWRGRSG